MFDFEPYEFKISEVICLLIVIKVLVKVLNHNPLKQIEKFTNA